MDGVDDVREKTYTYLRMALVALLVALGFSVIWQTYQQGWTPLDSVSAYYYSPAQGIFVGSLIGLGACMIALRGVNAVEEAFLNLGGMFAAVVAVVPTSRGKDYQTAIQACRESDSPLLTQQGAGRFDCPTVRALAAATRANVENNLLALVVVGALSLAAVWYFTTRNRTPGGGTHSLSFRWGFWSALALVAAAGILLAVDLDFVIANVHFISATGLLVSIVVVAVSNAVREEGTVVPGSGRRMTGPAVRAGMTALQPRRDHRLNVYAGLAWALVVVAVLGAIGVVVGLVSLFWVELAVAALFVAFWLAQTLGELPPTAGGGGLDTTAADTPSGHAR
ncbi:MAG TPA: hypothetical protein VMT69_02865 [Kineosporiaceae bacterium]|nr:hypothetical protein [Kineosporiaceae bacterium]